MKLVFGLGNPGKEYEYTRHNVGFIMINYIINKNDLKIKKKFNSSYAEFNINKEKILLIMPETFMNLSGDAVLSFKNYFDIKDEDILIIHDDVDFEIGSFKIKKAGSSAGHNGIKDIINKIHTENINRVRIGISKNKGELSEYVLNKFSKEDLEKINYLKPIISNIVVDFSSNTIDDLMLKYNKKD